ncbi:MAG: hypothetical protein KDC84_07650 [Crocinitomicaceae bacterium]|nr:hypothetical protein [Crocinitomicaceae bacterium]
MKKFLLIGLFGTVAFACKYDYDCYCTQSGFGAGSKTVLNSSRAAALSECNALQAELAADTTNTDSTAITCDLAQQY